MYPPMTRTIPIACNLLTHHNRTDYSQLIIEQSCLHNVTALEGDLQTGTTHAKPHAVHVDVVRLGIPGGTLILGWQLLHIRRRGTAILEYWERVSVGDSEVSEECEGDSEESKECVKEIMR